MNKNMFKKRNYFWRLFTFSGYISPGGFLSEIGIRLIGFFCAVILMTIAVSVIVPGTVEELVTIAETIVPVMALLWAIPMAALFRRRLRDAGYSAKSFLWLLLPLVGWLIFLVRLFGKTVEREPNAIWFE